MRGKEREEENGEGKVTFSKHKNRLLKKSYEIWVLYDAEVRLIIFSSRGRKL